MKLFKNRSWSILLQTVAGASRSLLFCLVSCLWILASLPAPAIIDTNNNGISDIWERQYNYGELLPNNFNLLADPDGDGWDNRHEAIAGTDPFDGNPPTGMLRPQAERISAVYLNSQNGDPPTLVSPEAETITWPSIIGKQYILQFSTDLTTNWLPVGDPLIGTGETISRTMQLTQLDGSIPPKLFWRIAVNDLDTDGDGLTDAEEAKLGTDPYNPTTLAGIPDLWLAKNFTQILLNGGLSTIEPSGDPDSDSYTNLEEYLAGTDPMDVSSYPAGTPSVIASIPNYAAGYYNYPGHPCKQPVIIYLNQALPLAATFPGPWISDTSTGTPVPVTGTTVILPGRRAIAFVPSGNSFTPWPENEEYPPFYQIDLTSDTVGLAHFLPFHKTFTTTTAAGSVDSGPSFGITSPGRDYIDAACDATITAQWSEPLAPATVVPANVSMVSAAGNSVACTVSFDYGHDVNLLRITPAAALAPATQYTVTLGTGFQNLTAKAHAQAVSWSFTTRPVRVPPITGAGPYVASVSPGDFAFGISPPSGVTLTFSEAMDSTTLTADHIHLRGGNGPDLPGTFAYTASTKSLLFVPATPFTARTYYALTLDLPAILNNPTSGMAIPMQGNGTFVFSTAPVITGGGTGGGGGGGSGGTHNPKITLPFSLNYTWGETEADDGDSGCSVTIDVVTPDGQQQQSKLEANTTRLQTNNGMLGPLVPDGSTVRITPHFVPGNDKDTTEELPENSVVVSQSYYWECGSNYLVFRETSDTTGAITTEYLGKLSDGTYEAGFSDADDYHTAMPQTLILVPVNIQRKLDAPGAVYENIDVYNYQILPGQQCNLKIDTSKIPQSLNPLTGLLWTFTGDAAGIFSNFVMNDRHGERTPFPDEDFTKNAISFYWAEPYFHTCTAKFDLANGTQISLSVVLYVFLPHSELNGAITGQYTVIPEASGVGYMIKLLHGSGSASGFEFSGMVSRISNTFGSEGKWAFVQLVNDGSYYTSTSGRTFVGNHHGILVLDTKCPYIPESTTGVFDSNGDSPSISIDPDMQTVGTQDQFKLYQMFKPPGDNSKWVPLKSISWQGEFMASQSDGHWHIGSQFTYASSTSSDTFIHPVWTANFDIPYIDPFKWVPQNPN